MDQNTDEQPAGLAELVAWLQERCLEIELVWRRRDHEWQVEIDAYRGGGRYGNTLQYGPHLLPLLQAVRQAMTAEAETEKKNANE